MSLDARITAVTVVAPEHCNQCNGTGKDPDSQWDDCPTCHGATKERPVVRLRLESRDRRGHAGQESLTITNPPTLDPVQLGAMVGIEIWSGGETVMIGGRRWAKRIGYTRIELV